MKFLAARNDRPGLAGVVEAAVLAWLAARGGGDPGDLAGNTLQPPMQDAWPGARGAANPAYPAYPANPANPANPPNPDGRQDPDGQGYQWKLLFLPHGTRLRTSSGAAACIATVAHNTLIYKGQITSPHQFVRATVGAGRNAWREILVRLPGETSWTYASVLRRKLARAHDPGAGATAGAGAGPNAGLALPASCAGFATDALAAALAKIGASFDTMLCLMEERTVLDTIHFQRRHGAARRVGQDRRLAQ